MADRTIFSVDIWKHILEEAESVKAKDIMVELGINRRITLLDKEGKYLKDIPA